MPDSTFIIDNTAVALAQAADKGAANGYASLDAGTKVPTAQLGGAGADATKYLRGDQSWQVPPAGGSSEIVLLYDNLLAGNSASLDTGANGIAAGYKQLMCFADLRSDEAVVARQQLIRFNNDSGANYDSHSHRLNATTTSGLATAGGTSLVVLLSAGSSATAARFGHNIFWIDHYDETAMEKDAYGKANIIGTNTTSNWFKEDWQGHWRSTAAISRMAIVLGGGSNFVAGSRLTIYGIL